MTVGLPSDQSHEQSENIEFANSISGAPDNFQNDSHAARRLPPNV